MKKIIALLLVISLTAAIAVGGTLAYFTDRDSEANVFTVGNVEIDLNEDFEQGATLIPGVDIKKEATITNTGINDAWVWVTIAIPSALDNDDASKNVLHFNYDKDSVAAGKWNWKDQDGAWNVLKEQDINGVSYNVYVVCYDTKLAPEATTEAVMTKVYLDPHVDIDPNGDMYHVENGEVSDPFWNVEENGNPVILVSAYAMQAEGFDTCYDAYEAYQTQWTTTDGVNNGLEYSEIPEVASNSDELVDALKDGGLIVLIDDVAVENYIIDANVEATIELDGNTLSGDYLRNEGNLVLESGTLKTGTTSDYAMISVGGETETVLNEVDVQSGGGGIGADAGAQVTINGGSVDVSSKSTSGRYNIYAVGEGTVVTINGGEYSFSKTLNQKRAYIYAGSGATVYVNGGTFGPASTRSGYTAGILGDGTVIITGGTFGFDPSTWVAEGYEAVKNEGTWTVSAK